MISVTLKQAKLKRRTLRAQAFVKKPEVRALLTKAGKLHRAKVAEARAEEKAVAKKAVSNQHDRFFKWRTVTEQEHKKELQKFKDFGGDLARYAPEDCRWTASGLNEQGVLTSESVKGRGYLIDTQIYFIDI